MKVNKNSEDTPANTLERDDEWKGFRTQGKLEFSMIGILSRLAGILAENKIGIFAVSTFNTDYILVKDENFDRALKALASAGYDNRRRKRFYNRGGKRTVYFPVKSFRCNQRSEKGSRNNNLQPLSSGTAALHLSVIKIQKRIWNAL